MHLRTKSALSLLGCALLAKDAIYHQSWASRTLVLMKVTDAEVQRIAAIWEEEFGEAISKDELRGLLPRLLDLLLYFSRVREQADAEQEQS